ncbi:MAG: FadR family transcriptional regulator [Deltaproteobacteria bacterium]|nr:FadR family transcriptional regulator [Deltaproteobacteria bacterium]
MAKSNTSKPNAAESAAHELRRRILMGDAEPGSLLPGERELAENLGVSRVTIRSALATLQSEGLVEKVHGAGNRVLDFREHGGVDLIAHLARYAIEGGEMPLRLLGDLLEFRRLVATQVMAVAAERGTPSELRALRDQREVLGELLDDGEAFMREDLHFARILVRATHNLALELLYNTVQRIITGSPGFEAAFLVNARDTIATYDALLDLLETRDPARIRKAAARFLEPLDRKTLDRLGALSRVMAGGSAPAPADAVEES